MQLTQQVLLDGALKIADELNRDTAAVEEAFMDERLDDLRDRLKEAGHAELAEQFTELAEAAVDLNNNWNNAVGELEQLGAKR